ncbi:aryl-alcohol dehydrogenase-like predicted oxidoreductase [Actinocorallia herbida]|uniref:Aryl-alcohol dehydrogenase-like predicted oxidoreductase n=1 Tax=Actinocorallia herbida TaxID=58109 RepID=A0A3N1D402_9ACTN|nr:aldo/keto reductase [Actinocorallia herbida]ROO88257.1 aryl-alcohol dehydrogenase-like predicted oxidoreductase [Actinocorallia herbida]
MRTVDLGSQGLKVSAQGLGCMGMSQSYGVADDTVSLATIDRAFELGVTFFDTSDIYGAGGIYGFGANERLLGYALRGRRDEAVIATKCGIKGIVVNGMKFELGASPEYVKQACEDSLTRLGTDRIDLYYLHRVDPDTPIEDTVGAMAELVTEGKVRYLGLSEVTVDQLERAHAVHPISALQSEYSLWTRGIEAEILPALRRLGIGLVPFSPLGRGFLTGTVTTAEFSADDMRNSNPRFTAEAVDANQAIVAVVREIAAARGVLPGQVALAWVHSRGADVVPIPGTKRPTYLEQNAAAADVALTAEDLARLGTLAAQATGSRY